MLHSSLSSQRIFLLPVVFIGLHTKHLCSSPSLARWIRWPSACSRSEWQSPFSIESIFFLKKVLDSHDVPSLFKRGVFAGLVAVFGGFDSLKHQQLSKTPCMVNSTCHEKIHEETLDMAPVSQNYFRFGRGSKEAGSTARWLPPRSGVSCPKKRRRRAQGRAPFRFSKWSSKRLGM